MRKLADIDIDGDAVDVVLYEDAPAAFQKLREEPVAVPLMERLEDDFELIFKPVKLH